MVVTGVGLAGHLLSSSGGFIPPLAPTAHYDIILDLCPKANHPFLDRIKGDERAGHGLLDSVSRDRVRLCIINKRRNAQHGLRITDRSTAQHGIPSIQQSIATGLEVQY